MSTPVTAIGASDSGDPLRITYHPAFASGAKQTITMLRAKLRRHEEIFDELRVVLGVPEDTNCDELSVLVGLRLRDASSCGA